MTILNSICNDLTINDTLTVEAVNKCVTLFFGYQTSDCLRPCKTTETRSKLVSRMDMHKPDEMRIRIKFNPTVTLTTTDFVKPSLGVFMSEVRLFTETHRHKPSLLFTSSTILTSLNFYHWITFFTFIFIFIFFISKGILTHQGHISDSHRFLSIL